jgi:hypothetical protein
VLVLSETEHSMALTLHRIECSEGESFTRGYLIIYHSSGHYQLVSCAHRLIVSTHDATTHPLLALWLRTHLVGTPRSSATKPSTGSQTPFRDRDTGRQSLSRDRDTGSIRLSTS